MNKLVFFDLETQKSHLDVGGWKNKRDMLMSVGVTYNTADKRYHVYIESEISYLIEELHSADIVVGFNILSFDYEVLSYYNDFNPSVLKSIDIMEYIRKGIDKRMKLDNLAQATLGTQKLSSGIKAIEMFRNGEYYDLIAYCHRDVCITKELYEYGLKKRYILYNDRYGMKRRIPVDWSDAIFQAG